MTAYACRDCGHPYGERVPAAPIIALHRAVSHSGATPIVEVPALPIGLTGSDPMPYGYRRWNGAVWPDIQVDAYNSALSRIMARHAAGMPTETLVNGLYNLARGFDYAGQDA